MVLGVDIDWQEIEPQKKNANMLINIISGRVVSSKRGEFPMQEKVFNLLKINVLSHQRKVIIT